MIKMGGTTAGGRKFLIIGLSEGNLKRLREKKPIVIHKEEANIDSDIIICWGPNEDALVHEFRELVDEKTRVTDRREEKKQ